MDQYTRFQYFTLRLSFCPFVDLIYEPLEMLDSKSIKKELPATAEHNRGEPRFPRGASTTSAKGLPGPTRPATDFRVERDGLADTFYATADSVVLVFRIRLVCWWGAKMMTHVEEKDLKREVRGGKRKREIEAEEEETTTSSTGREFEMDELPEEILLLIADHLDGEDLARLGATCRAWAGVAGGDYLWSAVTRKRANWGAAIAKTRANRPGLTWKQTFVNLFCLENGMCSNCFERSRPAHVCRERIEEELSNPMTGVLPLCHFFPGLHQHHRTQKRAVETRI